MISFINNYTYQYSPFIDDPVKIVNNAGSSFYHVKHIMQLNFFTVHEEYQFDLNRNIIYTYGHDYVYGATQTTQTKTKIGSENNYIDYVGTQQGLSCALKYQFKRYEVLDSQLFMSSQHTDDEIQQIYVYNIPSQTLAGKIIGAFSWNQVGLVKGMYYDEDITKLSFLDDTAKKVLSINLDSKNLQTYLLRFKLVTQNYNS
ncbi:hypothetical protein ABPG73_000277 [Tetrahymena malaccensis]